jgi:hypothetical protein
LRELFMEKVTVHITPDTTQKFVLVYGVSENGEETTLLWGNPKAEWHKDIVDEMVHAGFANIQVLGGGRINVRSAIEKVAGTEVCLTGK